MVSSPWAIVLGVISGVITSAALGLLGLMFKNVLVPWYQETFLYKGHDLTGTWEIGSAETTQTGQLELKQRGNTDLTGTLTLIATPEASGRYEDIRTFHVTGTFTDKLVELSFRHTDRSRLGAGVLLLELVRDGRVMMGVQAMYSVITSRISSARIFAVRPGTIVQSQPSEQLDAFKEAKKARKRKKRNQKLLPKAEGTPSDSTQEKQDTPAPSPE